MIVPLILSHHSLNILDGERGRAPPRLWKSIIARNTMFPCIPEERGTAPWPRARCSRLHISSLPVFTPAEMTLVGKIGFSSLSLWLCFTDNGAHKYKVTKYFLIFTNISKIFFFKLWCCRRFLRVPWTPRRSNWSILKEIKLEYSLEVLMLKLQYFGHQMRRVDSLEKMLILGKIKGRRRGGQQRMRWLDGIINSMDTSFSKFQEMVKAREDWHAAAHGMAKSWTQLSNWTTTTNIS